MEIINAMSTAHPLYNKRERTNPFETAINFH